MGGRLWTNPDSKGIKYCLELQGMGICIESWVPSSWRGSQHIKEAVSLHFINVCAWNVRKLYFQMNIFYLMMNSRNDILKLFSLLLTFLLWNLFMTVVVGFFLVFERQFYIFLSDFCLSNVYFENLNGPGTKYFYLWNQVFLQRNKNSYINNHITMILQSRCCPFSQHTWKTTSVLLKVTTILGGPGSSKYRLD